MGRLARSAGILVTAVAAAFLLYGATIQYGFHYDDYYFIKPYTRSEVLDTFSGSWDRSGIMVPFYRPLTIAFFALRFELLGLNAVAHHTVSLALFSLAATLAGLLIARVTGRFAAGALAALVFAVHPAMPYGQAVWITNQMHLLSSLLVLSGLLWWYAVANRHLTWWLPLLGLAVAAFMVKEDNIMLLPAVIVLHWLRRRIVDPRLRPVPRSFVVLAGLLAVGLIVVRQNALGGLGGYGRPGLELAWLNFAKGLRGVFWLRPPHRPWQPFASWFAILLPALALALWMRVSRGTRFVLAAGAALGFLFNLPFVFVSKGEQMHLVAAGASLLVTGSILAVIEAVQPRLLRLGAAVVLAAGVGAFAYVGRHISTDFAPFGEVAFAMDEVVRGWAAVPHEMREYLRIKGETAQTRRLSPNPVDELTAIAYGLHPFETAADGLHYRWMSQPRAELLIAAGTRHVTIPIRHDAGAFQQSTRVTVRLDASPVEELTLADADWRTLRYALRAKTPWFGRMHRLTIEIPRAWIPANVIPGSKDGRVLGLQIGEISVR